MNPELVVSILIMGFAILHFLSCYYGRRNKIGLVDIYLWMTGVYVGFGPVLSYAMGYETDVTFQKAPWAMLGVTYTHFMGLIFAKKIHGTLQHPSFARQNVSPLLRLLEGMGSIQINDLIKLYVVVWMIRLYDIVLGGGFSGLGSIGFMLSRNYFIVIIDTLLGPVSAMIIVSCIIKLMHTRQGWVPSFFLLTSELLYTFTTGRREMINVVFLAGLALFAVNRRIKTSHALFGGIAAFILFSYVFPVFLDVRSDLQRERSLSEKTGIFQVISQVTEVDEEEKQERWEDYTRNLQFRGISNYQWVEAVVIGSRTRGFMYGESMLSALMKSLPRFARPIKYWHDHGSFIQRHLGLPTFDAADNLISAAYVDFGIVGVFLYAFLFGYMLQWATDLSLRTAAYAPLMGVLIFLHFLPRAISFEESTNAIFVTLRSVAMIFIFAELLKMHQTSKANPFLRRDGTLGHVGRIRRR